MGRRTPLTPDEEIQIGRLYQEEILTFAAIADRTGRSISTVSRVLRDLGISLHPRVPAALAGCSDEELVKMYTVGLMDTYEISRLFGVCSETISKRLKANGVKMRPPGIQGAKLRSGERGVHGLSKHPLYQIWNGMIQRCSQPTNKAWSNYGGAGVTVCERWRKRPEGFANFLEDIGERPPGTSLDRIDPFGNYEPSNCRWATIEVQSRNKRGSKGSIQRMTEEIEMWRERALTAERLLAQLSADSPRRPSAKNDLFTVTLFDLDADGSAA